MPFGLPGESGKWKVESGKWEVGSGKWEVESGKWKVGSGKMEAHQRDEGAAMSSSVQYFPD